VRLTASRESRGPGCFVSVQDADTTASQFLNALARLEHEDAKAYISKNFVRDFDLIQLSQFFQNLEGYKSLLRMEFNPGPKNCATNSFLVLKDDSVSIIHLRMIREPDGVSNWKIYGIDQE
jgi:hypothetical protein